MPSTVAQNEVEDLIRFINAFRERTGASIAKIANESGVRREILHRIVSRSYGSTPGLDMVVKIGRVVGFQVRLEPIDEPIDHD